MLKKYVYIKVSTPSLYLKFIKKNIRILHLPKYHLKLVEILIIKYKKIIMARNPGK